MAITEPLYHLPLERYANTTKDSSSGRVYCATDAPSPQWRFTRLAIVLSCLVAIIANPCSTRICNYENICLAQLFKCKQAFANMQLNHHCFVAYNDLQLWECVFFVDSFDSIHSQFLLPHQHLQVNLSSITRVDLNEKRGSLTLSITLEKWELMTCIVTYSLFLHPLSLFCS